MEDIDILNQLLNGNHLSNSELDRAKQLIHSLEIGLKGRVREKSKDTKMRKLLTRFWDNATGKKSFYVLFGSLSVYTRFMKSYEYVGVIKWCNVDVIGFRGDNADYFVGGYGADTYKRIYQELYGD